MMGRSHAASGALVGAGAAWLTNLDPLPTTGLITITAIAALLPDADHPDATIPRYFGWPGRFVAWLINAVFGHRGLTHSLIGVAALIVGMAFVPFLTAAPWWIPAGIVLGCLTHIAGDACTVSGVPLLWPSERRYGPRLFTTGTFGETHVLTPLMLAAAAGLTGATLGLY
jgi:inner membrane protein